MSDRSLEYRPYLDGLRGIAVLFVFVFHAARPGMPGGFIGVDIFFVLSGYLITRILISQDSKHGRIPLGDFYARRVRRLMPAVVLLVFVVVGREALWGNILETAARLRDTIATLFYFENWNLIVSSDQYFAESLTASPLRHAWSLSIEEQLYLVWPLLMIGLLVFFKRRYNRINGVVLGLVAISAAAMALLYEPQLVSRAYYGTDTRVQQPLIGAALAFFAVKYQRSSENSSQWLWPTVGAVALTGLVFCALTLSGQSEFYFRGGSTVVALLVALLILALERNPMTTVARVLSWNPLKQLGQISYGFYLWHWPIILWLAVPSGFTFWERRVVNLAQFGLTLAISITSFILLENPIRSGGISLGRLKPASTIATGLGSLAVVGVVAFALLGSGAADPPVAEATTVASPAGTTDVTTEPDTPEIPPEQYAQIAEQALADRSYEPCPRNPEPCVKVEGTSDRAPTVVLIGDSTAQAYDPALKELAAKYEFTYVQAAVGGCPLSHRLIATGLDGQLHKPSNLLCYEKLPDIYKSVLADYDPALFIATSWNETNQHVEDGVVIEKGTPEHLESTEAALRSTVAQLTSGGARVAFIDVLPPGNSVECLDNAGSDLEGACTRPVEPASAEAPYNEIFSRIADDLRPSVVNISLLDVICPDGACPLIVDGVVMRYDGGHLTATASRRLAPVIDQRLKEVGIDLSDLGDS